MNNKPSKVLVIGSGPIIIGQAAEFDYAGTQACKALREEGVTTVLVNSNPATIMTDEDIADVVYIEPLTLEVVTRIIAAERPDGLLPTLGGQTGLNLAVELADAGVLDEYNVRLLGTPLNTIRNAEDRELFKQLLSDIGEPVLPSVIVESMEQAYEALDTIPLPLVVRPAYTLGGTGGGICTTMDEFNTIVASGLAASPISQVLLERSLIGWKEIEYEVMRDGADNCITICNMENIDPMGVHTGDSIVVAPSQTLTDKEYQLLRSVSLKIIRALGIEGGCNIQMALAPGRCRRRDTAGRTRQGQRILHHRGQPARQPQLRPCKQGNRLPHRPRRRQDCSRQAPRRNPQRRHTKDARRVRACARLLRGEDSALALRQVPRRRPLHQHADEGDRRGHGDRPLISRRPSRKQCAPSKSPTATSSGRIPAGN